MVALAVALTFLVLILADLALHRTEDAAPAVRVRLDRFGPPPRGAFVSPNHLLAEVSAEGLVTLRPDPFLREAVGPDAAFRPAETEEIGRGEALLRVRIGGEEIGVGAPFSGRIILTRDDAVVVAPRRLGAALRGMRIGDEVSAWWNEERGRLERFLGASPALAVAMPDGGDLVPGFLAHLPPGEAERFRKAFLDPPGG